jgi:hypothetical protein
MKERTLEKELPRHEELVDERLVLWYFLAAEQPGPCT